MNDIRRVLRAATLRLTIVGYVRAAVILLVVALAGAIVARLVQQAFGLSFAWDLIAYWTGGAVLGLALVWAVALRESQIAVARHVDEGGQLREALSTALCVLGQDDPWARVTVEAAGQRARTVNVRQAVPIHPPRFWPVPLALGLALLIVWMLPTWDLLGIHSRAQAEQKKEHEIVQAKAQADDATKKVEELVSKLNLGEAPKDAPEADKPTPRDPDSIRLSAIKKLTNLKDQLEQRQQGDKAQQLQGLREALKQLKTPGEGPLSEMSNELAKGNFKAASEELQKAIEKLSSGKMSEKDKQLTAEQMKKLAEQLEKLAQDRKQIEKSLENAGLDKKLAGDPEALKKAIEQSKSLTDQQKQQLMQQALQQAQCASQCQGMAGQMSKMAGAMGKQGMDQKGMEGAQGLGQQLSDMEMMAADLAQCQAAAAECKAQLAQLGQCANGQCQGMGECQGGMPGTKPWAPGYSEQFGQGRGGPGLGAGGSPGDAKADTKWETKKFKTPLQDGPIIGSTMIQGEQIRGESRAQFAQVAAAADAQASEALENNVIPREYHDAVKHYFGRLKAKSEAQSIGAEAAKPAEGGGGTPAQPEKPAEKKNK